jgi:transcriptional regulator with XRE-family HTH domain
MSKAEFVEYLQQLVNEAGSQKELAARLKISTPYLNDILLGRRDPSKKILNAIGFEEVKIYRPKQ